MIIYFFPLLLGCYSFSLLSYVCTVCTRSICKTSSTSFFLSLTRTIQSISKMRTLVGLTMHAFILPHFYFLYIPRNSIFLLLMRVGFFPTCDHQLSAVSLEFRFQRSFSNDAQNVHCHYYCTFYSRSSLFAIKMLIGFLYEINHVRNLNLSNF